MIFFVLGGVQPSVMASLIFSNKFLLRALILEVASLVKVFVERMWVDNFYKDILTAGKHTFFKVSAAWLVFCGVGLRHFGKTKSLVQQHDEVGGKWNLCCS